MTMLFCIAESEIKVIHTYIQMEGTRSIDYVCISSKNTVFTSDITQTHNYLLSSPCSRKWRKHVQ